MKFALKKCLWQTNNYSNQIVKKALKAEKTAESALMDVTDSTICSKTSIKQLNDSDYNQQCL